jgi:hypothetical protein
VNEFLDIGEQLVNALSPDEIRFGAIYLGVLLLIGCCLLHAFRNQGEGNAVGRWFKLVFSLAAVWLAVSWIMISWYGRENIFHTTFTFYFNDTEIELLPSDMGDLFSYLGVAVSAVIVFIFMFVRPPIEGIASAIIRKISAKKATVKAKTTTNTNTITERKNGVREPEVDWEAEIGKVADKIIEDEAEDTARNEMRWTDMLSGKASYEYHLKKVEKLVFSLEEGIKDFVDDLSSASKMDVVEEAAKLRMGLVRLGREIEGMKELAELNPHDDNIPSLIMLCTAFFDAGMGMEKAYINALGGSSESISTASVKAPSRSYSATSSNSSSSSSYSSSNSELEKLKRDAARGDPTAQCNLGTCYCDGRLGLESDPVQAAYWYQKSADQGFAQAQTFLGTYYCFGRGVTKDPMKGLDLLQKAAAQGNSYAIAALRQIQDGLRGLL